ncbi:RHS repeat-associated core domain-containing protein [Gilliamella sp. Pas-s25]|uniref:RHS repeat-associated core domain-containing protein n=1 Tax=Gilliamella sp. Pas-s25 TaxID=2687310 RepID=UPI00135D8E65|nr:RHS repeat-associated core domain-containing protein [Gilliamella sp. Pas-s25]MWP62379.1 hypothetical protein [Gilliamella sp. Pas-s25]
MVKKKRSTKSTKSTKELINSLDELTEIAKQACKKHVKDNHAIIHSGDANLSVNKKATTHSNATGVTEHGSVASSGGKPQTKIEDPSPHITDTPEAGKNAKGQAVSSDKHTPHDGDPISLLTGEELLSVEDGYLTGIVPFIWQRFYRTSAVELQQGLGYGWSHFLSQHLVFNNDSITWSDHENRQVSFPYPTEKYTHRLNSLSEAMLCQGEQDNEFIIVQSNQPSLVFKRSKDGKTAYLKRIIDQHNNAIKVIYNTNRLPSAILSPAEQPTRKLVFIYENEIDVAPNENNPNPPNNINLIKQVELQTRVAQQWQRVSVLATYTYNSLHQLVAVTNAANETEHYSYDDKHVIQSRVMAGGATFYWAWQNEGKHVRCLRQWANFPQLDSRYQWNDEENSVTIIHQDGSKSYYKHNTHGKLVQKTSAAGNVQTYEYNDKGQLTAEIDGEGHITYYDYSPITGALDTITYPDGHCVNYDYLHGEIYTITHGDKETYQQWRFRRDSQGNLLELIDPQERSTVYQYNAQGKPIFIQYPDHSHQRLVWSEQGELLEDNSSIQGLRQFGYDAIGRLVWEKQQDGSTTHYRYDALNRITKIILPDNTTREYRYNAYGKVIWFKDEMGKITQYDYAAPLHLLTQLHQPNGEKLTYQYDNGHLQISQITNQKGEHYQFRYTADGLLSEEIGFDNIKTTYHYNKNNQLIARCEYGDEHQSEPFITRYERDSVGRLVQKILPDGNIEHYEYDTIGRLIAVKDNDNVLCWEYNKSNQLIAEHQNWATIRHRYDDNTGLLSGTKLPDGQWLEYHYNHGQLLGMTLDHQPLAAFRWDKQGREYERRQGNGLVNRYDYDNLSRLTRHQIFHGFDLDSLPSPTPLWQQDYRYQADNQLSQIRGNSAREYQYDAIGQLTSVGKPKHHQTHHAPPLEMLHYDATGNFLSDTKTHITKGNRLTFFSDKHFEYDRFGNLIVEKRGKDHRLVTHYEYDCRHRLIKVIKPTGLIITYTYDAFNRRTSKTVDGKTTEFIWQDHKLIAECADNDKFWRSYIYEPDSHRPLAQILGKAGQSEKLKTYWYQNNYLGTPHRLTDSLGDTVYECEYSAYGEITYEHWPQAENNIKPINPLRFQGQYFDEETGLHYNLNRYYDPFTGRYITQDPLGILGGLNSYQYAGSDPINWVDPLGLLKIENSGFEGVFDNRTELEIDPKKFDYLYGKVTSGTHNTDRSTQLSQTMRRLGLQTDESGTKILTEHFDKIINTQDNIIDTYIKGSQKFEIRESLLIGPSGKATKLESSFEIMPNGSRRFVTTIPKEGKK